MKLGYKNQLEEYPKIFIHIPKTAGTTLINIIRNSFSSKTLLEFNSYDLAKWYKINELPIESLKKYKLIYGHMGTGSHIDLNLTKPYFTFFRNPLERVISYYSYVKRNPNHRFHNEAMRTASILGFLKNAKTPEMDNGQTRQIAGVELEVPIGSLDEKIFELAINNLENHYFFIGLVERFDESILLLKNNLGIIPYYKSLNVTEKRMQISDLSEEAINFIEKKNRFDIDLYKFAQKKFENQINKSSLIKFRLIMFRSKNFMLGFKDSA